MKLRVLAQRWT